MQIRLFNTLQRYIFKELFVSTFSAVITINLFAFVVSALVFVRKFPVMGASFFMFSAPPLIYLVLPYTLSLGLLVGVTLTFGQIANQREEIIMQFNGISHSIFSKPIFFLGFLGILCVFFSTHYLQPIGFFAEDNRQFDVLKESLQNLPSGSNAFSFKTFSLAYDERVDNENNEEQEYTFKGLTLLFTKDSNVTQMIRAEEGSLSFSKKQYEIFFDLKNCYIVLYKEPFEKLPQTIFQKTLSISRKFVNLSAKVESKQKTNGNATVRLTPENPDVAEVKRRIKTMNTFVVIDSLKDEESAITAKENDLAYLEDEYWAIKDQILKIHEAEKEEEEFAKETEESDSIIPGENSETESAETDKVKSDEELKLEGELEVQSQKITELKEQIKKDKKVFARNKAELFRRFGMTIAPMSFILLGFPLGLLLRQGNKLVVFSLSLLIIGVVYYPVEQYFIRLVQQDLAAPLMVTVLPNVALLLVAFVLSRFLTMR